MMRTMTVKTTIREKIDEIGQQEENGSTQQTALVITGLHCSSCAKAIERALQRRPGVVEAELTFALEKLVVKHDRAVLPVQGIKAFVTEMGFGALAEGESLETREQAHLRQLRASARRVMLAWLLGLPVFVMMVVSWIWPTFTFTGSFWGDRFICFFFTTLLLWVGRKFFLGAYQAIRYAHLATSDVLISLGAGSAYLYSVVTQFSFHNPNTYYDIAAMVLTFISTGSDLKARAPARASEAIGNLGSLQARTAPLLRGHQEADGPLDEGRPGDIVLVKPRVRLPLDGVGTGGGSV